MKLLPAIILVAFIVSIEAQFIFSPTFDYRYPYFVARGPFLETPTVVAAKTVVAPAFVGTEAKYVAKTPGVEHTAPLTGHLKSVMSVNDDPAPGTL